LPKTPEVEVLAKELLNYELRMTEDANVKAGTHDDLVTALGLATQTDPQVRAAVSPPVVTPPNPIIAATFERYRRYS